MNIFHFGRRTLILIAAIVVGAGLCGGIAWAYWTSQATGVPAYAAADAIGTSAAPTATANGNAVNLSWPTTTTVAGKPVTGYLVARYAAASGGTAITVGQGSCAANPVTTTGCAETGVPAGTWYYTITPVLGGWRGVESGRGPVVVGQDGFALAWPNGSTLTAGTTATLTITAQRGSATDTGYTGAKTLTFSGPGTSPNGTAPSYPANPVSFTNGVATVPVTLYRAESTTLAVADGTITGGLATTVTPAAASQFGLSAVPGQVAGTAFTVTVTALDPYGNTAIGYTGGKTLTWSGPGTAPDGTHAPSYPANPVTFTAGVAANLPVTLYRAQSITLTATAGPIHGSSTTFTVSPGAASRFGVVAATTATAGIAFAVTVSAQDAYQNAVSSYSGAKTLTWSGPTNSPSGAAPTKPAGSVTFTSGVATVSFTLVDAGATTLGVSDGTLTGTSASITVSAGAPVNLAWTQLTASAGTVGSPCLFTCQVSSLGNNQTVTAEVSVTDSYGNVVSNLGSSQSVTVATTGGGFNPGGTSSVTLTVPAGGVATSGVFTFKSQNSQNGNNNWTDTLTASGGYSSAMATVLQK